VERNKERLIFNRLLAGRNKMISYNCSTKTDTKPGDLMRWTEGRALVATGSPFASMKYCEAEIPSTQRNSVYIFPEALPSLVASLVTRATDRILVAAAYAPTANSPAPKRRRPSVFEAPQEFVVPKMQRSVNDAHAARLQTTDYLLKNPGAIK
jgi:malic enzyme